MGKTNTQLQKEVKELELRNADLLKTISTIQRDAEKCHYSEVDNMAIQLRDYAAKNNVPVMLFIGEANRKAKYHTTASIGSAVDMIASVTKHRPNLERILVASLELNHI